MEFSSFRWQTILKFNNTVYGRSLIVTSHVWACKVLLCLLLWVPGTKTSKIFPKFGPDHAIAGIQQLQCYHKWLETKENLLMNIVNEYGEKQNGFTEVVEFCHLTCRYFDGFLLQGVGRNWRQASFFYLAPNLICEGYWLVNSWRSIFHIVDPTLEEATLVYILYMHKKMRFLKSHCTGYEYFKDISIVYGYILFWFDCRVFKLV